MLLAVLVTSYRQVIAAFPTGGGAYAVASSVSGRQASLIAAASLIVDYVLNAAVGVSAGVAALWSAYPALCRAAGLACLAVLALITAANLWGVAESARLFIVPTVLFIIAIAVVILGGLVHSQPVVSLNGHLGAATEAIGVLLLLKAFASGCSALSGVEAIANAVPEFKQPRARRAQHTEMWLGILLGLMLIGISVLIRKFHLAPSATVTTLAQLTAAAVGRNIIFYAIQLITTVLLALAANTSFGGLPVLASLLARDNFLPHLFRPAGRPPGAPLRRRRAGRVRRDPAGRGQGGYAGADPGVRDRRLRRVHAVPGRDGQALARRAQRRLVRPGVHQRPGRRADLGGAGHRAGQQFTEGAYLVVIVVPLLVLMFHRIASTTTASGTCSSWGQVPPPPRRLSSLVVVPVGGMSRLTAEAISVALSIGDEVIAVTVCYGDPEDEQVDVHFRDQWEAWHPNVPLITLRTPHRSLAAPVVKYLRQVEDGDRYHRLVVLIPEVQPERWWRWILHNQRGFVLQRAIQRGTSNVVIAGSATTWPRLRPLSRRTPPRSEPARPGSGSVRARASPRRPPARPAPGRRTSRYG